MFQLDSASIRKWKEQGIGEISCFTVAKGCAGKKIEILVGKNSDCDIPHHLSKDIICWTRKDEQDLFEDAYITAVGSGWIIKSDTIASRCGCTKSFSLKTGNPRLDKIKAVKLKLQQAKEGTHTD